MHVKAKLRVLQSVAQQLETDAPSRKRELHEVAQHTEQFLQTLSQRRVYTEPGARTEAQQAMRLSSEPAALSDALSVIENYVDGIGHNLGSSRFFAYIPSGSLYESALADYIAAISNRYAGVGVAAPGATRMDETLLRWLAEVIGYPQSAEGDLTSGGSTATLSAIVTAREAHGISSTQVTKTVVYLTSQTHHTFRKALGIAGLGDCVVRQVDVDADQRMDPARLQQLIEQDRAQNLTPWLVAATAGTTDVGAVDPLNPIADIAQRHGLWLHVDAAYGGAFVLCEEGKRRLAGLERSDSLILDPHKGFFLPCGTGVLLVREGRKLFDAYHARGAYMQDLAHDTERSPCDLSPELSRPFRALRFWLPLKVHGINAFAAALEEKLLLAQYFYEQLAEVEGVDVGSPPDLSIVPFRCVPKYGDANAYNQRLLNEINADGRVFMTSTTLAGKFTIRVAILNYMTHLEDVDLALEIIKAKISA